MLNGKKSKTDKLNFIRLGGGGITVQSRNGVQTRVAIIFAIYNILQNSQKI